MYKLSGLRKNGMEICKYYDNKNVALFEFEITQIVAINLELYEGDALIKSYNYKQPEVVTYFIEGQSPYNSINKSLENKESAVIDFNKEKDRCNWVALYEEKNGKTTLIECYVKGA